MPTDSGYRRLRARSLESRRLSIITLGLAAYIYSLDGTTTYTYLSYATSEFGDHSLIGPIQVAQGIIIAVGKPVIAKIADVGSRGRAYCGVLLFYIIGYSVIATSQNIQSIAAGIILYAIGLQLLTQAVIADITTLKWRGLVLSLNSLPFLINAFMGSNISTVIIQRAGWRWGYGMFVILIPIALSPLIGTLLWSEHITRRRLGSAGAGAPKKFYTQRLLDTAEELDAIGLLLIGASISLMLLPLSLAQHTTGVGNGAGTFAMLLVGIILVPVFALWEFRFARYPVIPFRFVVNRSVVGASLIGAFNFMAFYLTFTYLYSFVVVVKDWKLINSVYFMQTQMISMTLFGILTGMYMHMFRRYKTLLVGGLVIRLIGVALMLRSRGADGSNFELLMTQVLQGAGGGVAALAMQVSSQASVPHVDVAMVTAVVLLVTEFGAAGGGAIAGAIWSSQMPSKLAHHLPFLSQPERDGVIAVYSDVMKTMVLMATAVSVLPILFALGIPDWHLGDGQNAVDAAEGEEMASDDEDDDVP
ncbi:major facilitator superfamily domain-containing protein [Mycena rosella]|uniref:Major facilitator superfamily domain-containing protein n=1 Tax=Mycena rosella TaxID=1033263 RepID=A0AAD7H1K2_MYCRO|nr:major facilitator superfamily domain-containing protein [Mycena rosella]